MEVETSKERARTQKKDLNVYPFGLKHKGYNNVVNGNEYDYKQFQGQEFTDDLGLNVHEWKYRISDPAIGRFWQVDPLAESYEWMTTYQFSSNQPIHAPELEGLESAYDLNTRDPGLNSINASAQERRSYQNSANQSFAVGAAVTADVILFKGAVTTELVKQVAVGTAINGAEQFFSGKNIDAGSALNDAVVNADLFDAGYSALSNSTPGASTVSKAADYAIPGMVDITIDGGFQVGGVNKSGSDVGVDMSVSIVADNIKTAAVPKMKYSGNRAIMKAKAAVTDYVSKQVSDSAKSNGTSTQSQSRPYRAKDASQMLLRQQDNTRVRPVQLKKF